MKLGIIFEVIFNFFPKIKVSRILNEIVYIE